MSTYTKTPLTVEALRQAVLSGDRIALGRAISLVENGALKAGAMTGENPPKGAPVIGLTGTPGVGKSTLINGFIHELRRRNLSVAVASVDPSSPITGGAILGDRVRMSDHIGDSGVFVRSLASRGHLGGLCQNIREVIEVIKVTGEWDFILLETVGTGQSETEISLIADLSIVVTAPGQGDEIQAMKAGILEIADILVVNKADLPGSSSAVRNLEMMLKLRQTNTDLPVIKTTASEGAGIDALVDAVVSLLKTSDAS